MNQQLTTTNDDFNQWLETNGYVDSNGVLTVELDKCRALYLQQDIQNRREKINENFIEMASDLWEVFKGALWLPLGFNNYLEFLYSPEVDLNKTQGYGLKEIGKHREEGLLEDEWLRKVGVSKAITLLPKLNEGENVEEWKAKAEELTALDLEDEVAGREIIRYSGTGPFRALIAEIEREKPILLESEVRMYVKTVA